MQHDCLCIRGKWLSWIYEYDMDIRPTKLVKGQGLAKMLIEENERVSGLDEEGDNNTVYAILDDLEHHHWYSDIVYYLKNLTSLNGLAYHQ
jgi:hypothetical protein